jgi:hypothetical protein
MSFPDWMDSTVQANPDLVAKALAEQILVGATFDEAIERLETEAARNWQGEDGEHVVEDFDEDMPMGWEAPYAAAKLLRQLDERQPELRQAAAGLHARLILQAAKQQAADEERGDPARRVLVSPRLRGNLIERVVVTFSGDVVAEWLHETGWRRHKQAHVGRVLSGEALPERFADAISRGPGMLDGLSARECLDLLKDVDPDADFGDLEVERYKSAIQLEIPCLPVEEQQRVTYEELIGTVAAPDSRHAGMDSADAEIAAELLRITPGLAPSVELAVWAEDAGFHFRITGSTDVLVPPSARLRVLIARRFEAREAATGDPWFSFTFVVKRLSACEWLCHSTYQMLPD